MVGYPTYGGSGVIATELGKGLAEKGHKVHFITYAQPARIEEFSANMFYHEVDISTYPLFQHPPYVLALASNMVSIAKYEKLDVLHVHYAIPHAAAALMAKEILKSEGKNIPVVTTLHGTDITLVGKDASYAPVVTYSINGSDAVTAVSKFLKADTERLFEVKREIEVVPNFIDLDRFKKQKKEHFKTAICPNGEKLLVHTSNFRKVKRVEEVALVFQRLRDVIPCKLLMIGDGPERKNIENMCRDLGICDDLRFLGKINAVDEVLSVADLFLMPSEQESFGLAALEAMACQVPVISSNAGGIPELNLDGVTGFCSDIGDVDDMVKNALTVLSEENLETFKANASKRAQEYDIHKILPMYEAIYERVAQAQPV